MCLWKCLNYILPFLKFLLNSHLVFEKCPLCANPHQQRSLCRFNYLKFFFISFGLGLQTGFSICCSNGVFSISKRRSWGWQNLIINWKGSKRIIGDMFLIATVYKCYLRKLIRKMGVIPNLHKHKRCKNLWGNGLPNVCMSFSV